MKTTKQVTIIARYQNKKTGVVSYLVRSSDGKSTYCTTVIEGKASGCSCPSRKGCYHKTQLAQREQERKEVASQFSAKHAPSWLVELVAKGVLVAPKAVEMPAQEIVPPIAMELPAELKGYRKTAVSSDLSTKGSLNGAQQSAALLMVLPSRRKTA